ncbi:MAG: phosphoribosylformylglycinamidine cyclo-ligase [Chloroflexi bacterium]|nr:phosphoribosylformylglycinamidine cyclo-ligase [Chloroflexota bacterium]
MTDNAKSDEDRTTGATYAGAGVDAESEESALKGLLKWVEKSLALRTGIGAVQLPIGYFANVVDIGHGMGLAISTDGVGTKLLVAQMMNRYDTVGIDCVAMNVNDVLCVGAEPVSLVDCIAVQEARPDLLEQIGKGLYKGAELAKVNIPAGEIAQIKEIVRGEREGYGFDLVGTCVGLVPLDRIIIGREVREGDAVVGLRSSGVHSNGLTLAREVLFKKAGYAIDRFVPELGRTVGEELLEPTRIYVTEVMEMLHSGLHVKALSHITGDGMLNLLRVKAEVGYVVEQFPEPQPVFKVIQRLGQVTDEEAFRVFNMGIGLCVTVPAEEVDQVIGIARKHGVEAHRLGYAVSDPERKVVIQPYGLVGQGNGFRKA